MSAFEYVSVFLSIVLGLAVVDLSHERRQMTA
jgi:hypothetical protein